MTESQRQRDLEEQQERQEASQARGTATQTDQRVATQAVEERMQNPEFLEKFATADADSQVHDWIEGEMGPVFSRAHILGYRSQSYERQAEWLGQNHAERVVTEQNPGSIVKHHPDVLAVMQGRTGKYSDGDRVRERYNLPQHVNPPAPHRSDERRALRDAEDVATQRKMLSIDGEGKDALTKATSETKHVRDEREEESKARSRLKRFLG